MTTPQIKLRHIAYTSAKLPVASLSFRSGVNVVFGASNTGKSFSLKSIDCMLGSERAFPNPKLRQGYESVWLGLEFSSGRSVTLFRAASGGDFLLYEGLVTDGGQSASTRVDVSDLILGACGLAGKKVVDNAEGHKQSLTIRTLAPHLIVTEKAIMDEGSPIHTGQYSSVTAEKNIFRLLLTGTDDSKIVSIASTKGKKARKAAKLELLDELITQIESKLGEKLALRHQLADQLERLDQALEGVSKRVQAAQKQLDFFSLERRRTFTRHHSESARLRELDLTIDRFNWLLATYASDKRRLEALDEGTGLLAGRTERTCTLCGALPANQTHPQTSATIAEVKRAASGEVRRISRDHDDLEVTIASLLEEAGTVRVGIENLKVECTNWDNRIDELRPNEAALRTEFEEKWALRNELIAALRLFYERDELLEKKQEIEKASKSSSSPQGKLAQGVDGPTAHEFAKVVQEVLKAWKFPGSPQVTFEESTQDIRIDGVDRRDNGKGVRAILHAAFKVGLILYCHRNGLPHPGFLVLDTPLLTYRDPLVSRHGELLSDEKELKASPLKTAFYEHLLTLEHIAQILILENDMPPEFMFDAKRVQVFQGPGGLNRVGFFPAKH